MKKAAFVLYVLFLAMVAPGGVEGSLIDVRNGTLLKSDFNSGVAEGWALSPGWSVEDAGGSYALCGTQHSFAYPVVDQVWSDYEVSFRFNIEQGWFHFNFRTQQGHVFLRYCIGFMAGRTWLGKQVGDDYKDLLSWEGVSAQWHDARVVLSGNTIKVYVDGSLKASCTDESNPLRIGNISFESVTDDSNGQSVARILIDDVKVEGVKLAQSAPWLKMGGPIGGLGYDVRIHPLNKDIMFVTDNPSGVQKSTNGGARWTSSNKGITARIPSSDTGVPIFSLTIDPNNTDIIWAGTQGVKGLFKSVDGGETWLKRDNGIDEGDNISFRGFAVKPGDSQTVLAAAEISTGVMGEEFDKAKGKIYKTTDGGAHWRCVWQGDSLARVLIFNPVNPNAVYCSTGIFDREAWNGQGVGILKSKDGGETWRTFNNGIDNLFVSFLAMHPKDPNTLYAASGMNVESYHGHWGGIYKTTDGGKNWVKLLGGEIFGTVVVSPSHPETVYAGCSIAFYRSDDGGLTWKRYNKPEEQCWGPPGVRPGFPVSSAVDPDSHTTIFANNYGGGVFKSTDGAATWVDASKGYTGATIRKLSVGSDGKLYAIGRSGPFKSPSQGAAWKGLAYGPAVFGEWNVIAARPGSAPELLASDEHQGVILKSTNRGSIWRGVFRHPSVNASDPANRHGFRATSLKWEIVYWRHSLSPAPLVKSYPPFQCLQ